MAKPAPPEVIPASARAKAVAVLVTVVLFGGGLLLLVGIAVTQARLATKIERLRSDGVAATATLEGMERSRHRASVILWYMYQDRQYHQRIRCAEWEPCDPGLQPSMKIWIDPARPTEFVADNGSTDDSGGYFGSWGSVLPGGFLIAFGGVAARVCMLILRPNGRGPRPV
jgi:hypothetical protein